MCLTLGYYMKYQPPYYDVTVVLFIIFYTFPPQLSSPPLTSIHQSLLMQYMGFLLKKLKPLQILQKLNREYPNVSSDSHQLQKYSSFCFRFCAPSLQWAATNASIFWKLLLNFSSSSIFQPSSNLSSAEMPKICHSMAGLLKMRGSGD